jgi:hypothetical protein
MSIGHHRDWSIKYQCCYGLRQPSRVGLSGSAYVIGDVDHHYLIIEVAGNSTFCTYGGAFNVLDANYH